MCTLQAQIHQGLHTKSQERTGCSNYTAEAQDGVGLPGKQQLKVLCKGLQEEDDLILVSCSKTLYRTLCWERSVNINYFNLSPLQKLQSNQIA